MPLAKDFYKKPSTKEWLVIKFDINEKLGLQSIFMSSLELRKVELQLHLLTMPRSFWLSAPSCWLHEVLATHNLISIWRTSVISETGRSLWSITQEARGGVCEFQRHSIILYLFLQSILDKQEKSENTLLYFTLMIMLYKLLKLFHNLYDYSFFLSAGSSIRY